MNGEIFLKWVKNQLLPDLNKLNEKCVVIMDNAPYHSVRKEKPPNSNSKKIDMQAWLQKRNIYFTDNMTKVQLWSVIKPLIHGEQKCYVVDELLQSHGHQVLRLPAYHCQYNAIELVWAFSKNYYNKHVKGSQHTENKVTKVWKEGLDRFTPQMWQNSVNHCQKLIKEDWKKYMGNFSLGGIPRIIISLAESDDSHSDFDFDSNDE